MSEPLRLVWAYDRPHLQHPFIVLGLNSFVHAGIDTTVVSSDKAMPDARYDSQDAFSFSDRDRNYRTTVERVKSRQAAAREKARRHAKSVRKETKKSQMLAERWSGLVGTALNGVARLRDLEAQLIKAEAKLRRNTLDTWRAYLRGFRRLFSIEADVIMASRPEAAFWAGFAAKLRGLPFVYYPFELYGDQFAKPNRIVATAERLVLRWFVDGLVTQNELRADVYVRERRARVEPVVVRNYKTARWDPREAGRVGCLRAQHPSLMDKRIVLYEGSLIDGRWLDRLAQSVLHLPDDVALVMMGREGAHWLERSAHWLEAPLATGRLLILPPVPHEELPQWVADADLGVIIYDGAIRNNFYCATGKLGDYVAVGVPVLAPNFPTIAPVVNNLEIGVCFEGSSPEDIAKAIQKGLARPKAMWAPALRRACEQLTWETQFPSLLTVVMNVRNGNHAGARRVPLRSSR
jgi:glycosyltransferase involved in cell wall biosynthesis